MARAGLSCGYEPPSLALSVPVVPHDQGVDTDTSDFERLSTDSCFLGDSVQCPYKVKVAEEAVDQTNLNINAIDADDGMHRVMGDSHRDTLPMPSMFFGSTREDGHKDN